MIFMGDPKKQKKKFESPRYPWRTDIIQNELRIIGQYGLRNKRELWSHRTMLSKFRGIARSLLGMSGERRSVLEKQLLTKLRRLGILPRNAVLDNVLDMSVEDILERRLQTLVFRRGLTGSIYQAREFISHGHIAINKRRISSPGYLVPTDEESELDYYSKSPFSKPEHPTRKMIETANVEGLRDEQEE